MAESVESASPLAPTPVEGGAPAHGSEGRHAELAYQTVTIAAILLVLVSLWVF